MNDRFPLYMEKDRHTVFNGDTRWINSQGFDASSKPSKNHTVPVKTYGDMFVHYTNIIGQGFGNDPCPPVESIDKNPVLFGMGSITAQMNAEKLGVGNLDVADAMRRDASILHHWQHYRWVRQGRAIYDISPALADAFLATELNVLPADINLPTPTCYIAIPPSLGLKIWHAQTGHHVLDGFYVSVDKYRLYCCAVGFAHGNNPSFDNALSTFAIHLDDERTIDQWISEERQNEISAKIMGPNADEIPRWMSLVINSMLYVEYVRTDLFHDVDYGVPSPVLAHANTKIPGKKGRNKYLQKYRSDCRYIYLGRRTATISGTPTGTSSSSTGAGNKLTHRVMVRGHWRNQPHGPKNSLRRLTWIQPHWKGDESLAVKPQEITTIYKVV